MMAYFTASIEGKKYFLKRYLLIVKLLKSQKYQVISDHIINSTEESIRMENKEDKLKFQRQLESWIQNCDFVVAEASFPSISVGYEISLAANRDKPVLILYSNDHAPSLLEVTNEEKIVCQKYKIKNLKSILTDFINFAKRVNDIKLNFFISPRLFAYLEKVSKKEKMPKSVYLRKLIDRDIKNHRN